MKMKRTNGYFYLLLGLLLFGSCKKVEVDFLVNGKKLISSDIQPEDLNKNDEAITVYSGESIMFTDVSDPDENVDTRSWRIDGIEFSKENVVSKIVDSEGPVSVKLCINNEENCVTKWLNVVPILEDDNDEPIVTFSNPSELYSETNDKYLDIEVDVENIFSKDELKLIIKDTNRSFSYDESTGRLSKKVILARGKNKIEVKATTEDNEVNEFVYVTYNPNYRDVQAIASDDIKSSPRPKPSPSPSPSPSSPPAPKPIPKPLPKPDYSTPVISEPIVKPKPKPIPVVKDKPFGAPQIEIMSPKGKVGKRAEVELTLRSKHLTGPQDLTVLLNGQKVSGLKFLGSRKVWIGNVILIAGSNTIEAIVKNGNGTDRDLVTVDYENSNAAPTSLATIGVKTSEYNSTCSKPSFDNYSFSITPQKYVELLEFVVYSDICGGVEILMNSPSGVVRSKMSLIEGKNQISLTDLDARLDVGTKYTFTLKTISGFGMCEANINPQLEDAAACNIQTISSPDLNMDTRGRSVIYDLKYLK